MYYIWFVRILPRIPLLLLVWICPSLTGRAQLIRTYGIANALKMDTPRISPDSIKALLQKGNCQLSIPLQNLSDSALDLFLYCGDLDSVNALWFKKGTLIWHTLAGNLCRPEKGSTLAQRYYAAVPLHFEPSDSGRLVLDFHQVTRQFEFRGVNVFTNDALNSAQAKEYEGDHAYYVFQWLFQGFLVCQLLYIFLQWLIVRRKEYLYYLGYLSIILLYFLSKYETFLGLDGPFSQWPMLKVYLGKTLLIFPYFLYLRFIRSFLEIPKHWPVLNRWLKWMEYYLLVYTTVDLILIITTGNVRLQTEWYTFTLLAFFILTTWSSVYLFLHRQTLIYYILGGSFALAVGSILGQVLTYLIFYRHMDLDVQHILLYPQLGILLEILCFTAGLGHKNQIAEKEKLLSQQKLIDQRIKIAQDLHDDIGSTLSSISILSELAIHEGTIEAVHEIDRKSVV